MHCWERKLQPFQIDMLQGNTRKLICQRFFCQSGTTSAFSPGFFAGKRRELRCRIGVESGDAGELRRGNFGSALFAGAGVRINLPGTDLSVGAAAEPTMLAVAATVVAGVSGELPVVGVAAGSVEFVGAGFIADCFSGCTVTCESVCSSPAGSGTISGIGGCVPMSLPFVFVSSGFNSLWAVFSGWT